MGLGAWVHKLGISRVPAVAKFIPHESHDRCVCEIAAKLLCAHASMVVPQFK